MKRALVSVSDKTGLVEFVQGLVDCGYEIISTGGTKKALEAAGIHPIGIRSVPAVELSTLTTSSCTRSSGNS